MSFNGYFALNGVEIANNTRTVAHLGTSVPTSDVGMWELPDELLVEDPPGSGLYLPGDLVEDPPGSGLYDPDDMVEDPPGSGLYPVEEPPCALVEVSPGLFAIPASSIEISPGLYSPPDGSRRYGPGLYEVTGTCWGPVRLCDDGACGDDLIGYDDSWPGLRDYLDDVLYRPEIAPWYSTRQPESAEFAGMWVMDVTGLDTTSVARPINELVGAGGAPGPHRDVWRKLTFQALLIACTNAGVKFGLDWLNCNLRATVNRTDSVLRYFAAHPGGSAVDPLTLVRDAHAVVLTREAEKASEQQASNEPNRQSNLWRVTWEMAVCVPYVYRPPIAVPVVWDAVTSKSINWLHAVDCVKPETCEAMPMLFSTDCQPEVIDLVSTPPPVCGGCMPVCEMDYYSFKVPTFDRPYACRETAVRTVITNIGDTPLTLQAFWRVCNSDIRCEDKLFPLQVSGLPVGATLVLDSITGNFWAISDGRIHLPVGVVQTPTGAPWRPTVINRQTCYEFVVTAPVDALFEMDMTLSDREP